MIKETDTRYLHRHIGGLKSRRGREHRVKLCARVRDAGGERTARADTSRIRDFGDHRAGAITYDHVIIRIKRAHVFHQRGIQNPDCGFFGLDASAVGKCARRGDAYQRGNCGWAGRAQVYKACVRVGADLYGPALSRTLRGSAAGQKDQEHEADR